MSSKSAKSAKSVAKAHQPRKEPQADTSKSAKSAKSVAKVQQPRNEPEADIEISRSGRERRPSDKIAAKRKFVLFFFIQVTFYTLLNSSGATRSRSPQSSKGRTARSSRKKSTSKSQPTRKFA